VDVIGATLILRAHAPVPAPAEAPSGTTFRLLTGASDGVRLGRALRARYGVAGTAKTLAKLATRGRLLYCVLGSAGEILHDGWLRIGAWSARPVAPRDVVIGPLRTRPDARNRGLARYGLTSAMSELERRGHDTFLLSTTEDNAPARALFARCGFAEAD
jgi:L-amino acid N-acyltransferase YncA